MAPMDLILFHHSIIFIPFTLHQLVFSPSHCKSPHLIFHLLHKPSITPHPLVFIVGSPFMFLCSMSHMFSQGYNGSSTIELPFFFARVWISFVNIIDVLHLNLPCPYSYHHISFCFIDVQHALCIHLAFVAINPSNIAIWHAFLFFFPRCFFFLP